MEIDNFEDDFMDWLLIKICTYLAVLLFSHCHIEISTSFTSINIKMFYQNLILFILGVFQAVGEQKSLLVTVSR